MKKLFQVHEGGACNSAHEKETVTSLGGGVAIVHHDGVHNKGSIKLTRYQRQGRRIEPWYLYVNSVTTALFLLAHAMARGLLRNGREASGRDIELWLDVSDAINHHPDSVGKLDNALRLKHSSVMWFASIFRAIRHEMVDRTVRETSYSRSDVWRSVTMPTEQINKLLVIIDTTLTQFAAALALCEQMLGAQHGEPTATQLPQQPARDQFAQDINDVIAGLNQVRDATFGATAKEVREALRTTLQAMYGIAPAPFLESATHARNRLLLVIAQLDIELYIVVAALRAKMPCDTNGVSDLGLIMHMAAHVSKASGTGPQGCSSAELTRRTIQLSELSSRAQSGRVADVRKLQRELLNLRMELAVKRT